LFNLNPISAYLSSEVTKISDKYPETLKIKIVLSVINFQVLTVQTSDLNRAQDPFTAAACTVARCKRAGTSPGQAGGGTLVFRTRKHAAHVRAGHHTPVGGGTTAAAAP
jgi:hypothetical protein